MGFIALKCPSCGADIELDKSREFGFCQYCGTKIVQDKQIIEYRGTINVDGIASEKALLERANMFLDGYNFSNAEDYYDRVLDLNPKCADAYWGLLKCKLRVPKDADLQRLPRPLTGYDQYQHAVKFANDEQKDYYTSINNEITERLHLEAEQKKAEDLAAKKAMPKLILFCILMVLLILPIMFFLVGTFMEGALWLIGAVVFTVPEFFVIRKCLKLAKPIQIVNQRKK